MSEKLADSSEYRHGNMVFFDLLGVFVVAYPARVGTILNYVVAAATFLYLAKKASQPGNGGRSTFPPLVACLCNFLSFLCVAFPSVLSLEDIPGLVFISLSGGRYVRDLACATGVAVLSWLVTLLSVLIVALLVTLLGRSMFWYNHFYTSICLYGAAATGKIILIHTLAKNLYYGVSEVFDNTWAETVSESFGMSVIRWYRVTPTTHVRFYCSLIRHLPAQPDGAFVSFHAHMSSLY